MEQSAFAYQLSFVWNILAHQTIAGPDMSRAAMGLMFHHLILFDLPENGPPADAEDSSRLSLVPGGFLQRAQDGVPIVVP
jgi:hypothetical protein